MDLDNQSFDHYSHEYAYVYKILAHLRLAISRNQLRLVLVYLQKYIGSTKSYKVYSTSIE